MKYCRWSELGAKMSLQDRVDLCPFATTLAFRPHVVAWRDRVYLI